MTATLYLSPRCVLCGLVAPTVVRWFERRGLALAVEKDSAGRMPGLPALVVGQVTLVGMGIPAALYTLGRS